MHKLLALLRSLYNRLRSEKSFRLSAPHDQLPPRSRLLLRMSRGPVCHPLLKLRYRQGS